MKKTKNTKLEIVMTCRYLLRTSRRFSQLSTNSSSTLTPSTSTAGTQLPGPFYPKLNASAREQAKSSGSSWKPSLAFLSLNVLPLAAIGYYLKSSIDERRLELSKITELVDLPANEVAARFGAICKACSNIVLMFGSQVIVPILPHPIESDALVFTTEEVISNIDQSIPGMADLFDAVTASREKTSESAPLNFIHFGVSPNSVLGKHLLQKKDRRMTLVYTGSPIEDVVVSVKGTAVVVEDQRLKAYYWRDRWGAFAAKEEYVLVKFSPAEATLSSLQCEDVKITRSNTQWNKM